MAAAPRLAGLTAPPSPLRLRLLPLLVGVAAAAAVAPRPGKAGEAAAAGRQLAVRRGSAGGTPHLVPGSGGGSSGSKKLSVPNVSHFTALRRSNASHNASHNASQQLPFNGRVGPAVGKVFALYYNTYSGQKANTVDASYADLKPAAKEGDVWQGGMILPQPKCGLKLTSKNYATDIRKANLRMAAVAVCDLLEQNFASLPSCGAASEQVCELELSAPLPADDENQEPYIAAAMGLVAYSRICALSKGDPTATECMVHRSNSVICAGLTPFGGQATLKSPPSKGLLDLKLDDAYILGLEYVYLAQASRSDYEQTEFYKNLPDVLRWQHTPPKVYFCNDLACLAGAFLKSR